MRAKFAIFGTSANPPHIGHEAVVRKVTDLADHVAVMPVYRHQFSEKWMMTPYHHRFEMACLAFQGIFGCFVSEMEANLALRCRDLEDEAFDLFGESMLWRGPISTYDVLMELQDFYAPEEMLLVLGSDTHADLVANKWRHSAAILDGSLCRLHVESRDSFGVSSTKIRESTDLAYLQSVLHPRRAGVHPREQSLRHRSTGLLARTDTLTVPA